VTNKNVEWPVTARYFDGKSARNSVKSGDDFFGPNGSTLRKAFGALAPTLNERRVRYAIIGGIALMQHTRARTTEDIDALLKMPQLSMPGSF
jgi:hypothetical protein